MVTHLLTARIAQKLRDAGMGCEIVNLVPTPTAVLRRDRIIVILALGLLTGLAWSRHGELRALENPARRRESRLGASGTQTASGIE
jgi:hypothetical protein